MKGAGGALARVSLELGGKSPQHHLRRRRPRRGGERRGRRGSSPRPARPAWPGSRLLVQDDGLRRGARAPRRTARARSGSATRSRPRPRWARSPSASTCDKRRGLSRGARRGRRARHGGARPDAPELRDGFFVEPTIFGDVDNGMGSRARRSSARCSPRCASPTRTEAVALANDTPYGLAAGVWTRDVQRAHRIARALRAGTVWINAYRSVGADGAVRRLQSERDGPRERRARRSTSTQRRRRSGSS